MLLFLSMIECQVNYAIDGIRKLIQSGAKSMDVRQEPFDQYHDDLFSVMKNRVFGAGGCQAWYLNSKGVNWTLWPRDLTTYWWVTRQCNLEDYHLN